MENSDSNRNSESVLSTAPKSNESSSNSDFSESHKSTNNSQKSAGLASSTKSNTSSQDGDQSQPHPSNTVLPESNKNEIQAGEEESVEEGPGTLKQKLPDTSKLAPMPNLQDSPPQRSFDTWSSAQPSPAQTQLSPHHHQVSVVSPRTALDHEEESLSSPRPTKKIPDLAFPGVLSQTTSEVDTDGALTSILAGLMLQPTVSVSAPLDSANLAGSARTANSSSSQRSNPLGMLSADQAAPMMASTSARIPMFMVLQRKKQQQEDERKKEEASLRKASSRSMWQLARSRLSDIGMDSDAAEKVVKLSWNELRTKEFNERVAATQFDLHRIRLARLGSKLENQQKGERKKILSLETAQWHALVSNLTSRLAVAKQRIDTKAAVVKRKRKPERTLNPPDFQADTASAVECSKNPMPPCRTRGAPNTAPFRESLVERQATYKAKRAEHIKESPNRRRENSSAFPIGTASPISSSNRHHSPRGMGVHGIRSLNSMTEQDKQLLFLMTVNRRIEEGTYL